ncbi:MAG: hypothetical protein JWR77_884 [Rhizorhabdus sp.]|nr:hypothetical protein [Rhizorhabdus sp.]
MASPQKNATAAFVLKGRYMKRIWKIAATSLLAWTAPAMAEPEPISVAEAEGLRREIAALKAHMAALEKRLDSRAPPAAPPPIQASWKGSPQFTAGDRQFKVKGRLQYDAGYVAAPGGTGDRALGFSNEARRIRLGGEGKLGGGFGYKLELELSDNKVDLVDTFVTYEKGPWLVSLGNQNQFQSLDELIGDTSGSFMERAAFTDAFAFERRIGLAVQYQKNPILLQAGVFTDDVAALSNDQDGVAGGDENDSWGIDGRAVYAPKAGTAQLHFGASAHLRHYGRIAATPTRYRQRAYLHTSNSRFLSTPNLNVDREIHYGAEVAAQIGRWHAAAEIHRLTARRAGMADAAFVGGYAEAGYFLTKGDHRAYRNGIFDRAEPASPLGGGGIGSIQLNLRYDYLSLNDAAIVGGKQNAYLAALIWTPVHYLRFNANYGYLAYEDAAIAAAGDRNYGVNVMGLRAELDF